MSSANSSSKRQEPLKQGTLSFATVKRVASNNATSKPKTLKPTQPVPAHQTNKSVVTIEDDDSDDVELYPSSSDDEDDDEIQESPDVPQDHQKPTTRAQTRAADSLTTHTKKLSQEQKDAATVILDTIPLEVRPDDVSKAISADEKPELDVKSRKWNKHYAEVKEKMGYLPPLHAGNQNKIHEILRVFDLSYEYGPCAGIPRLERWERAQALGLNPPKEVYDILNTKQGSTLDEYSQSVFHDEV